MVPIHIRQHHRGWEDYCLTTRTPFKVVCISGIDGSGKTSIINGLRQRLEDRGCKTRYLWLRYNHYFTKILLVFCRLIGLTRYEYMGDVRVGYHDFHKSRIISWLFVVLTFLDTFIVSVVLVYLPLLFGRNHVLICDRWVMDIMIDLEVDTKIQFREGGYLEKIFLSLLPSASLCFLVCRKIDQVLLARPENRVDQNFQTRWELYEGYSSRKWVTAVHNDTAVDDAVAKIMGDVVGGG